MTGHEDARSSLFLVERNKICRRGTEPNGGDTGKSKKRHVGSSGNSWYEQHRASAPSRRETGKHPANRPPTPATAPPLALRQTGHAQRRARPPNRRETGKHTASQPRPRHSAAPRPAAERRRDFFESAPRPLFFESGVPVLKITANIPASSRRQPDKYPAR